jgi:predicted trehalose synthase
MGAPERAVWAVDAALLGEYVAGQRWFGSKARERVGSHVVDTAVLREQEPSLVLALLAIRFQPGTHELYQLPLGLRPEGWNGVSLGTASGFTIYDALEDSALARELVHLSRAGAAQPAGEGTVEFHQIEGFAALGSELGTARLISSEQSNSSVVFDGELILKVYRRLAAGINPELEMLRFLTERGFANIASLGGWYAYVGRPLEATLGILQEFVPDGLDGWELALDELAEAPEQFLGRLRRLGHVTAHMHNVLASEPDDASFNPEEPSLEALGLLTASIDEEIEAVFLGLPPDVDALAPIAGRGEEVRERLRQRTRAGAIGRVIRHHGDYHLGQLLWTGSRLEAPSAKPPAPAPQTGTPATSGGDWVILDFEGEPARSLPERRRKRSPLRDVAGMLRSFAYAASAVELLRGAPAPPGWEERARREFLDGYLESVDPTIVPSGREAFDRLLSVFELEKAVYELRYELNMRPDWLSIPVAGILRLLEQPVGT